MARSRPLMPPESHHILRPLPLLRAFGLVSVLACVVASTLLAAAWSYSRIGPSLQWTDGDRGGPVTMLLIDREGIVWGVTREEPDIPAPIRLHSARTYTTTTTHRFWYRSNRLVEHYYLPPSLRPPTVPPADAPAELLARTDHWICLYPGRIALTLLIPPAAWLALATLYRISRALSARSAARRRDWRCAQCGYDLRATPDRCPECGAVPPPRVDPAEVAARLSEVEYAPPSTKEDPS